MVIVLVLVIVTVIVTVIVMVMVMVLVVMIIIANPKNGSGLIQVSPSETFASPGHC